MIAKLFHHPYYLVDLIGNIGFFVQTRGDHESGTFSGFEQRLNIEKISWPPIPQHDNIDKEPVKPHVNSASYFVFEGRRATAFVHRKFVVIGRRQRYFRRHGPSHVMSPGEATRGELRSADRRRRQNRQKQQS